MNPLYEMGFHRVGCVGCPMAGKQRYREFRIFTTYERAYRRAFAKMLELRKAAGMQFDSENAGLLYPKRGWLPAHIISALAL